MADQASEGLLSPWLRQKRIDAARRHLKGRILHFGCGSGALAELAPPDRYLGVDRDEQSLSMARASHAAHRFAPELPAEGEKFDSIVSLAVIEHVGDPAAFLRLLGGYLSAEDARLIVTTPHPALEWVHDVGARLGLFSSEASEEHESLMGRTGLQRAGEAAGLRLVSYRRFLFGANQVAVFKKQRAGR